MPVPSKPTRGTTGKPAARNTTTRKTTTRKASPGKADANGSLRSPARRRTNAEPTREQIAETAYYIWQEKGRPVGHDEEHWHEAEQRLRQATPKRNVRKKKI